VKSFYRNSHVVVFVYDITRSLFKDLEDKLSKIWIDGICRHFKMLRKRPFLF
jgi:hypothetical protein